MAAMTRYSKEAEHWLLACFMGCFPRRRFAVFGCRDVMMVLDVAVAGCRPSYQHEKRIPKKNVDI